MKAMRKEMHDWRMHLKPDKELIDLSNMFNPIVRGWISYYGRFYKSGLYPVKRHLNKALVQWARRKYKKLTSVLRGWINYYKIADIKTLVTELMSWIRRRLRIIKIKQWKTYKAMHKRCVEKGCLSRRKWTSEDGKTQKFI